MQISSLSRSVLFLSDLDQSTTFSPVLLEAGEEDIAISACQCKRALCKPKQTLGVLSKEMIEMSVQVLSVHFVGLENWCRVSPQIGGIF